MAKQVKRTHAKYVVQKHHHMCHNRIEYRESSETAVSGCICLLVASCSTSRHCARLDITDLSIASTHTWTKDDQTCSPGITYRDEDKMMSLAGSKGVAMEVTHPWCPLRVALCVSVSAILSADVQTRYGLARGKRELRIAGRKHMPHKKEQLRRAAQRCFKL